MMLKVDGTIREMRIYLRDATRIWHVMFIPYNCEDARYEKTSEGFISTLKEK
jgi:hypothetical protein